VSDADREAERRVMRARGAARRQGYGVRQRRDLFSVIDPWTNSIVAENLGIAELEQWISEGLDPTSALSSR
jgi:hypothetical protein